MPALPLFRGCISESVQGEKERGWGIARDTRGNTSGKLLSAEERSLVVRAFGNAFRIRKIRHTVSCFALDTHSTSCQSVVLRGSLSASWCGAWTGPPVSKCRNGTHTAAAIHRRTCFIQRGGSSPRTARQRSASR